MKIKMYDYRGRMKEEEISDNAVFIKVDVVVGDEIVYVYKNESLFGMGAVLADKIDPFYENRTKEVLDETYFVPEGRIEKWSNAPQATRSKLGIGHVVVDDLLYGHYGDEEE